MHCTFRLQEVHDGTLLTDDLEIHTLELPKLAQATEVEPKEKAAYDWARFLAAETDEERRKVAMQNPDIDEANEALGRLSEDPKARALARWREDQLRLYRVELKTAERRGLERGHEQGLEQGRKEGVRALIRHQLQQRFGPLNESILARLDAADHATLEQYAERVIVANSLAEVFKV